MIEHLDTQAREDLDEELEAPFSPDGYSAQDRRDQEAVLDMLGGAPWQ